MAEDLEERARVSRIMFEKGRVNDRTRRAIVHESPEWRQINTLVDWCFLLTKMVRGESLTPDESARVVECEAFFQRIKDLRNQGNAEPLD